MRHKTAVLAGITVFVMLLSSLYVSWHITSARVSAAARASTDETNRVIYLDQGWSQEDREWYYNFSQGSSAISYDIFLNLEVAGSQELFRSDANTERYGLVPSLRTRAPTPMACPSV
jgi:hypothetical protein